MTKIFFQNIENGRKYELIGIDPGAGSVTLKGELVEFSQPFDPELGPVKTFEGFGYKLVKEPE